MPVILLDHNSAAVYTNLSRREERIRSKYRTRRGGDQEKEEEENDC
jgi:hypothetical protein